MIIGTGVDIVEIGRIREAAQRRPGFLARVFTSEELGYALAKKNPWPHLAARFAAKEAMVKVFAGRGKVSLREIEVIKEGPVPAIKLHGATKESGATLGIVATNLSLSHSREYAVALVLGFSASREEES